MTAALDTLSAALFAPVRGEAFTLQGADGPVVATILARCDEHPRTTMPGSARTAFSLVFTCPVEAAGAFAGGHCLVSHPAVGAVGPLYVERILPTGLPPGHAAFQAVFN